MDIFLSYSVPTREDQREVLFQVEQIICKEKATCKKVLQLPNEQHPIFPIINTIHGCNGLICLAFEKYQTIQDLEVCYHTSPWVDIELALALGQQLPALVVRESHIIDTPLISGTHPSCQTLTMQGTNQADGRMVDLLGFKQEIHPQIVSWVRGLIGQ